MTSMKKALSFVLTLFLIVSCFPVVKVYADSVVEIFDSSGNQITEKLYITEYGSEQLSALIPSTNEDGTVSGTAIDTSDGKYVLWESNLPLLANVDDNGVVTAYDFSKRAVIQLWIDENIRSIPLVGESTADAIWSALELSGVDLDNTDTNTLVTIVSTIVGESLGNSLKTYLDNMNVSITATLYDSQGNVLGSDSIEVVVEKSILASLVPTGVHITNKKSVPTIVAVGSTVQLYGACTPVRLNQGIQWAVGKNALDTSASNYATVSSDGLVTFLAPGSVTIRVNPENILYGTFSDTITFNIYDRSLLPVESFDISGELTVSEGKTTQLSINNVVPAGAYKGDLIWTTSDPTIAVVDENGIVTGLNGGTGLNYSQTVTITATLGGVTKSVEVKVSRNVIASLTSVEIEGNSVLGIGEVSSYTSRVHPDRLNTNNSVERQWGVFDDNSNTVIYATDSAPASNGIITVDKNGNVTAISSGVGKLYVKATYNSSSVESYIEITCGNAITDFQIIGTTSLNEGDSSSLSISVLAPDNYEASLLGTVKWRVDDESVASVSPDGILLGRDAGGRNSSRTTTVYATISGVTRSATVTVSRGWLNLSKFTDGQINGPDVIIKDIPHTFTMETYPSSISPSATYWGLITDNGQAPWNASNTYVGGDRNVENELAFIDDNGAVNGKKTGKTTLYGFSRYLLQSHIERTKEIEIVEIFPESITLKAPDKTEYVEGEKELDLTGMEVYLNYNKEALAPYYSDWESFTDDALKCKVTDYTVSTLNTSLLDTTQYIIVSVERAGKAFNAVFDVTIHSKQIDSLTITPPVKTTYLQGEELDLKGLKVIANYLNAESEEITDYTIDEASFSIDILDVEQEVKIVYEHAGRKAEATFPVTIYGKPVVSVEVDGITGQWTSEKITFKLSCSHALDGATYYWKNTDSNSWVRINGDTYEVLYNRNNTIHFKAVNSKGYESDVTEDFAVMLDNTTPYFTLKQSITAVTNTDYTVAINSLSYGVSGIKSITVNNREIGTANSFTVSQNGAYTVKATANCGLSFEKTIEINNIDKEAPGITDITLSQVPADAPERYTNDDIGNFFSGNVVASATAEDSGVAGIYYIKYRLATTSYEPLTDWVILQEDEEAVLDYNFKGVFEFVAIDKAGNESSSYYSDGFVRDSVKPVITSLNAVCGDNGKEYLNGVWADNVIFFTPEADAFSGVYEYLYCIDDGEWQALSGNTLQVKDNGSFLYKFKAISYSGLESDVYEFDVNIDRTVPVIRVDFDGTFGRWTSENVAFTLATLNNCPSGCTYYYNMGNGWIKLDSNTLLLNSSTNAYYSFKAINGAGLESAPSDSYKVMIDNVQPTGYVIPDVTVNTDSPYDVIVVPLVGESGYMKIYFNGTDITSSLKATVTENGKYALTIIGNNMLSNTVMIEITNFNSIPATLFSYERLNESSVTVTAYNGFAKNVTVPLTLEGFEVKAIADGAFKDKDIISVIIPTTAVSIGSNCFNNCTSLEKAVIPSSVTSIAENAFDGCKNLTIYCYEGSYAQEYAEKNNIPYVLLGISPVGKTLINDTASVIFTLEAGKTDISDIIRSNEDFTVMAIPSYMNSHSNYFGTGSLVYCFKKGVLTHTYKIIVYGDLNGDGFINVLDVDLSSKASCDSITLEEDYKMASDFNSDGDIDAADFQQVVNLALTK